MLADVVMTLPRWPIVGRPQPGHDPDDLVGQVAGNTQGIEGRDEMARGPVEVVIGDAQAAVCLDEVRPAVTLGPAQCLTEECDEVSTVLGSDALGEEPADHRVGDDPLVQAVNGGGDGRTAADRLVDADRSRLGRRDGV